MKKNVLKYYFSRFKVVLFVIALVLSLVGSYELYHGKFNDIFKEITVILYSTFKLFAFVPTQPITEEAPLTYELAVWAAPAFTMVGFFSVFKKIFISIRHNLYHLNRKKIAVVGNNENCIEFIKNMNDKHPDIGILLLCDISDKVDEEMLHEMLTKVVRVDFSHPENEANKYIIRDEKVFEYGKLVCFEDEPKNYGIINSLNIINDGKENVEIYLQTNNYRLKELIEYKLDKMKSFDIHYFHVNDLIIKKLLEESTFKFKNPKIFSDSWEDKEFDDFKSIANHVGTYNILIIGFSKMSESFLLQASNLLTINPLEDLRVTIIDENINEKFEEFKSYKSMIHKVFKYELVDLKLNSVDFKKEIYKRQNEEVYSAAIFSSDDAIMNLLNADKLVNTLVETPFAIYVDDLMGLDTLVDSLRLRHKEISVFGYKREVLNKEVIIEEDLLQKAKEFNGVYNATLSKIMGWDQDTRSINEQWMELSNIKKESSIFQASHRATKLKLLGKFSEITNTKVQDAIENWSKQLENKSIEEQIQYVEQDPLLNFMTALEHKRWNNFYYMRDFKFSKNKDEYAKTHDCLIDDWDEFLQGIQRDKAIYDTMSTLTLYEKGEEADGN